MERLLEFMEKAGLSAMFISRPVNVKYVSHYTGEDSFLFITEKEKFFLTDPRYTEQVSYECPDYTIVNHRAHGSVAKALAAIIKEHPVKTIGYEATHLTVSDYLQFQKELDAELVPADGEIERYRSVKRPEEIACSRIACDIASRAYERILKDIRVGITEKELAARLSHYMVLEGSDTQPYGNILISGARTSLLHGIPSAKAIEYGDLVLMDYGCQYHGYLSDMTRTVVVGKATPKQKEVYRLEQQMVADVESFLKDGVSAKDAYYESTKAVKDTEYFQYTYTGIGHGVGMFVHEIPFMSPTSQDEIHAGNVMTVEPGIYIPGWGGIRIEDQVLITETGNENLISATKELIEL
ncbi:MAG: Xaa-Pro peptidase family protein [Clostridium sp.]|nr:Xaa-Pro peptidase family protein [Clostridium sp.]